MAVKRSSSPCMGEITKIKKVENTLNSSLFETELLKKISEASSKGIDFDDNGIMLFSDPFPCYIIKNFISDTNYVHKLKNELSELKFNDKSTDLFKFKQSNDLVDEQTKYTVVLKDLLFNTFRKWLQDTIVVTLDTTVDMSCAKYDYTDMLLCHDDELEGRRIAFIYYLVPEDWTDEDGGCLDLFSIDENGDPYEVIRSITPTFNSLVFFEVSEKSFHQVSEILTSSKTRLSVSGWFHGESLSNRTHLSIPKDIPKPAVLLDDEILVSWINPIYLNPDIVVDIEEQFEDNSEIQLKNFLLEDKYKAMVQELTGDAIAWRKCGPPNQRCFWLLNSEKSAPTVLGFLDLIKGSPFFKLLKKFTGLDFAILEEEDESVVEFDDPPTCVAEVRQWKHGCYTLLHDQDHCGGEFVLDSLFHLDCDDCDESMDGGYINYIADDGGEELVQIQPMSNCLSLVYRDHETTRFIKYYNHELSKTCKRYFDVSAVYFEGTKQS